jgi:tRNA dimethylallyltransferase
LYVRALLHGLCPAPPRVPALRAVLERAIAERGTAAVHRGLAAVDPPAAARIGRGDCVRLVRALEVALTTGTPLSRLQAEHAFGTEPYDALCVGLLRPVDELNARIDRRVVDMVRAGFLDEVRMLRRRGVAPGAPGLAAVGYREMLACADGALSLDEAIAAVARATRRFAKRQRTWFRRDRGIVWRHPTRDRARIDDEVAVFLAEGGRPSA